MINEILYSDIFYIKVIVIGGIILSACIIAFFVEKRDRKDAEDSLMKWMNLYINCKDNCDSLIKSHDVIEKSLQKVNCELMEENELLKSENIYFKKISEMEVLEYIKCGICEHDSWKMVEEGFTFRPFPPTHEIECKNCGAQEIVVVKNLHLDKGHPSL